MLIAKNWMLAVLLATCLTLQTGCFTLSKLMGAKKSPTLDTSLLKQQGYSIPPGGMPSPVAPNPSGAPRVILEVRDGGEKHLESIPLHMDRAVFIENIVQDARLHDHYGQLVISIMRPTSEGSAPVRLEARTNDDGKVENPGQNYSLMPGDHIIVNSDDRSSFERMIDKNFRNKM